MGVANKALGKNTHIDHAGPFNFLVIVNAHSKWLDVQIVNSTSATATISKLCTLFATHGLPEQLVSDNGIVSCHHVDHLRYCYSSSSPSSN